MGIPNPTIDPASIRTVEIDLDISSANLDALVSGEIPAEVSLEARTGTVVLEVDTAGALGPPGPPGAVAYFEQPDAPAHPSLGAIWVDTDDPPLNVSVITGPPGPPGSGTTTTTYYVSNAGSDAADGKSTSAPWKTVAKVNSATLNPGDQVLFASGQTFSDASLQPPGSGTEGAPISFGVYGTAGKATLSKGIFVLDHHWLGFDSLAVIGAGTGVNPFQAGNNSGHYAHHCKVKRCLFDNGSTSSTGVVGMVVYGDDWTIEANVVQNTGDNGMYLVGDCHRVRRNKIQNTGTNTTIGSSRHGIYFLVSNGEVVDNTIFASSTDGVSCRMRNALVRDNTIIGCQIGIAFFQIDTVAGTSRWSGNYVNNYSAAGVYVSPSDIGGNTVESFVILSNEIVPMQINIPAMDLAPLSGSGTYYL